MASSETKSDSITETVKTVVYALLIAAVFRSFFFQPFYIPTGSMKDTLLVGDFMFVNKMAYGYSKFSCPFGLCPIPDRLFGSEPERGDVVVFRHPTSGQDYIKRLIGLPGDTVQMQDGVLYLNGKEQVQTEDGQFVEPFAPQGSVGNYPGCENGATGEGADCFKSRYAEMLDGYGPHSVLNIRSQPKPPQGQANADHTPVFTVPEGHYFFMGDNRDNSVDSRFPQGPIGGVGMVPHQNLLGRADRVIFSSAGTRMLFFWTWRPDRFFKVIQ